MDNVELSDFLRSRRARTSPSAVGLAVRESGRRVPGLRREEVAQLAGVSPDYYKKLERGRPVHASAQVLDAVARALQLDAVERSHLFVLAQPPVLAAAPQVARPGLVRVMEQLDSPALVMGRGRQVLACNAHARWLYLDFDALPFRDRNMVRFVFSPAGRALYADWDSSARSTVAALREESARHPGDPLVTGLVEDLCASDADFRRWWADHDVYRRTSGVKVYHHATGTLTLAYEAMTPVGDDEQVLGVHSWVQPPHAPK